MDENEGRGDSFDDGKRERMRLIYIKIRIVMKTLVGYLFIYFFFNEAFDILNKSIIHQYPWTSRRLIIPIITLVKAPGLIFFSLSLLKDSLLGLFCKVQCRKSERLLK